MSKLNIKESIKRDTGCRGCLYVPPACECLGCSVMTIVCWKPSQIMGEIIRLAEKSQRDEVQQEVVNCVICGKEDTREMLATCEVCDTGPQCRTHGSEGPEFFECYKCCPLTEAKP